MKFLKYLLTIFVIVTANNGQVISGDPLASHSLGLQNQKIVEGQDYYYQDYHVKYEDRNLWGRLYRPKLAEGPLPMIIYVHGYGSSYRSGVPYAEYLAGMGYAVYVFDFVGGSPRSHSGGSPLEMSVETEANDLQEIIDQLIGEDFVDQKNVFLLGSSQGGYVSTLVASQREDIKALVLLYPAFVLGNLVQDLLGKEEAPASFRFLGMDVGKRYADALLSIDINASIRSYHKPVLMLHGTSDKIIPISSSYQALELFPDSDLVVFEGAGHGFDKVTRQKAIEKMATFLNKYVQP